MDTGFHVLEREVLEEHGLPTFQEISVVQFLKLIRNKKLINYEDYTVYGLDRLVSDIENQERLCNYFHNILRDHVNYLVNSENTFQFPLKSGKIKIGAGNPTIAVSKNEQIPMHKLFGAMTSPESDPNWFWHQLNVES